MIKIQNGLVTIPKRMVNRDRKHKIGLLRGNRFDIYEEEYYIPSTTKNIEALEKAGFHIQPYKDKLMNLRLRIKKNYSFLFDYQLEAVTKSILHGNLLIADDCGTGKCILPDTNVYIDDKVMKISDIWSYGINERNNWRDTQKEMYVYSLENSKMVRKKVNKLYREFVDTKIDKITLRDGSILYKTKKHRLLDEKLNWNKIPEKFVCVPSILPEGNIHLDNDLVKLIAWQISEGHEILDMNHISITQKDPTVLYELLDILKRLCPDIINNPVIKKDSGECNVLIINSKLYVKYLETKLNYEFGYNSRYKKIPDKIMQSDNENLKIFLQCYFDAESNVNSEIEISSASKLIIEQLSYMLRKFGIWMTIKKTRKCATNTEKKIKRIYWEGRIGGLDARKFLKKIDFGIGYKHDKLVELCDRNENTNIDRIYAKDILEYFYNNTNSSMGDLKVKAGYFYDEGNNPSRQKTEEIIQNINTLYGKKQTSLSQFMDDNIVDAKKDTMIKKIEELKSRLDAEVFYCDIKSIEEVNYKGYVYDLEIEDSHNYITNGMISHNTISSFAVAEIAIRRRRIRHVVVVCPDSIKKQWADEIKKFFKRKSLIIKGTKAKRKKLYIKAEKRRIIIINYDQMVRDFWEVYPLIKDNFLIIDEASILKNSKTQRNKSAKLFKPKNLLALTGTPIENKLEDGMVLGNIIQKDWMDMKFFKRNFCMFNGREFIGYKNTKLFGEMLAEISIRRTMKEVIKEMPKISVYERMIPINQSQKNLEIHISDNLADSVIETYTIFAMIESDIRLINMSKAKTLAGLKVQLKDNYKDAKIVELMEIVDEESGNEKIVVFTRFKKMATLIKEELKKVGEKVILGTGSVKDKHDIRRKFKDEDYRILVATDAYSYGVDLYFATTLINFDVLWNPAKMKQRTDRIIRATSRKPIKIFNLITEGGTESYIYEVMGGKKCLFEKVVVERPKEHLMEYIQGLKKAR